MNKLLTFTSSDISVFLITIIILSIMPLWLNDYWLGVLVLSFYLAVYAMNWDLLFGYIGEVNFGPTFFVGVGAYSAAIANVSFGLQPIYCLLIGFFMASLSGVLLVGPALRLTGPYFGLVTLACVLILQRIIMMNPKYTGGELGIGLFDIFSIDAAVNYYIALLFAFVVGVLLLIVAHSPIGLILQAVGQDPNATSVQGYNTSLYKFIAFVISASLTGLAGAFIVFYYGNASLDSLMSIALTIQIITATLVGGRRTIVGSLIGAIFIIVVSENLRPLGQLSNTVLAFFALLVILVKPSGIISLLSNSKVNK